ncbi:Vacuolar cation/proton exchanger 5 isoform B [Glycine soja]|nr:Vacuolar cation/proton exchanger 5 isoform B [Glycine soja]
MAVMGILFPAVLHYTHTEVHVGKSELSLSRFSSSIMLVAYVAYLFFQLKSQRNLYVSVNEGASTAWEIPVAFISVILLPLVGNAAEHASAIMFAMKDKLIPFCVVIGWITGHPMDLNFQLFETAVLFLTVIVVAFMLQHRSASGFLNDSLRLAKEFRYVAAACECFILLKVLIYAFFGMSFSIVIHNMGSWVNEPQLYYKGGEVHVIHGLDVSKWSYFEAMRVLTELGYKGDGDMKMWWKGQGTDFDSLRDFVLDQDAMDLANYALTHNCEVEIYVQHGVGVLVENDSICKMIVNGEQCHNGSLEQCGNVQESGNLNQLGNVKQSGNVDQSSGGEDLEKSNFNASAEERDLGMEDGFDLPEVGHVKATLNKKVDKMKNKVEGVTRGYGTRQRKNKDIARRDNDHKVNVPDDADSLYKMESSYYSDELDSDIGQDDDIESHATKHVTFKKEDMRNFIKQSLLLSEYSIQIGSHNERPMHKSDDEVSFGSEIINFNQPESIDLLEIHGSHYGESRTVHHETMAGMIYRSIRVVLLSSKLNLLMPFGPLAILVQILTGHHGWIFGLSLLGIMPMAERLDYVTKKLTLYTGHTVGVGGILNASFGNATELIISLCALKSGMIRAVQLSLLGSIFFNMLLVLGCAFFRGGIVSNKKEQVFNKEIASVNSGLLLMAVMGILLPAALHYTQAEVHVGESELSLSRFSSCIMLVAYVACLFFQFKSQRSLYVPVNEVGSLVSSFHFVFSVILLCAGYVEGGHNGYNSNDDESPYISKWESIIWLSVFTTWTSMLSQYLVDTLEGASTAWGIPVAFISVILLPLVGNDISLGVAIGSSTQISMFVIPFCVVIGWMMGQPMDLNFHLFETAALFLTVIVVAIMLQEGTANYFKGLLLILCYLIVAASFYVHLDSSQ